MSFAAMQDVCRFALINAKTDRAKQILAEMEIAFDKFCGYPHRPPRRVQAFQGTSHTYDVSLDVLCAAGDVIGNLVGALDHLAFQLVMAHSPTTSEPLGDKASVSDGHLNRIRKLVHPEAVELIKAVKPYTGGNEALGLLYRLNNLSKHRLLLNVAEVIVCHPIRGDKFLYKPGEVYFLGTWGRPRTTDYVLPAGIETINEIKPDQPEALFPTLYYLITVVDSLVQNFLPYL